MFGSYRTCSMATAYCYEPYRMGDPILLRPISTSWTGYSLRARPHSKNLDGFGDLADPPTGGFALCIPLLGFSEYEPWRTDTCSMAMLPCKYKLFSVLTPQGLGSVYNFQSWKLNDLIDFDRAEYGYVIFEKSIFKR